MHHLLIASVLWVTLAGLGLFFWYGMASDCCSELKYFHGISQLRGNVKLGWISEADAERQIAQMQQVYLKFVWDTAQSAIAVVLAHHPRSHILAMDVGQRDNADYRDLTASMTRPIFLPKIGRYFLLQKI